ncbi:8760_t:CDS:2, partial [Dentiscutata erythropus]
TFEPFLTVNDHSTLTMNTNTSTSNQSSYSFNQAKHHTSRKQQTDRDPVPVPVSVRKTTKFPTLIITTNTTFNLVQQFTSAVNLQPSNLSGLSKPKNIFTTKPNLLTANNLAFLPNSTANSYQDLPMDTHSNAIIKSLPKKSYTTALTDNQKVKPKYKYSGHQDFQYLNRNKPSLLLSTLDEIKAIINYISILEPIILPATSQQQVKTAIAFLHTHFTFREVHFHIINIPELPVSKWKLFNNYVPD